MHNPTPSLQSNFLRALDLHKQGKLDDAARGYEAAIAADERRADALLHLGVLRHAQDRVVEAESLLRRAIAAAPLSAEAHANLAAALQAGGKHEDAVRHYETALALKPGFAEARFGLAACLQALGRCEPAVACYRVLLDREPAHAEANYGLATLFETLGRDNESEAHYRSALAADADFAEAAYGLGKLLTKGGAHVAALEWFRRALDVDPTYDDAQMALAGAFAWLERDDEGIAAYRTILARQPQHASALRSLGMLLCRKRQQSEAIAHFEAALAVEPHSVPTMVLMATALMALERHAEAVALCHGALAREPDNVDALTGLGRALLELGEMKEAELVSRRAVELAPERPDLAFNLAQSTRIARGDGLIAALEALLPRASTLRPREQSWLHFALAKAYEDVGERDRGFAHLLAGNAIKRQQITWDEGEVLGLYERVAHLFTAEMMAARRGVGHPSDVPVFIVGMPRSGTTLIEQILASHPAVFGAGERQDIQVVLAELHAAGREVLSLPEVLGFLSGEQLAGLGESYLARLRPLAPAASRITDKLPGNFCWVGLIHLILPNAKIIHVIRDPVDTCLSCFSKLFSDEMNFAYDLGELGRYHAAYQRLMAHWRAALPPGAILEVSYENVVADFAAEARRLVDYCGLPWNDACLNFHETSRTVRTASVAEVRQPIYATSVGRWRPDKAVLQPLLDGLHFA